MDKGETLDSNRYLVLQEASVNDLARSVDWAIHDHYIPVGGILIVPGASDGKIFWQSVYLPDSAIGDLDD